MDKATKVVYLIGAGATQSEISYKGCETRLVMGGENGLAARILNRAKKESSIKKLVGNFSVTNPPDIEKTINLWSISGIPKYVKGAEFLRKTYFKEIVKVLHESKVLAEPSLAMALLELHKTIQKKEELSAVISLNHDHLFISAFQQVYGGVNLGFDFESKDRLVSKNSNGIPLLLHLHGCFAWNTSHKIDVDRISAKTKYSSSMLWIPPNIIKEARLYPYNKLAGLAHEVLSKGCDVLRIIGCSLSQNDWNLISIISTAQNIQKLHKSNACFKIELIMPRSASKTIAENCTYLDKIIEFEKIRLPGFDDIAEDASLPDLNNPFLFWLKGKVRSLAMEEQKELGEYVKKILGEKQ